VRHYLRRKRAKDAATQEEELLAAEVDDGDGPAKLAEDKLNTKETMRLSAEFCLIWFFVRFAFSAKSHNHR
jgi:hypothetical protein